MVEFSQFQIIVFIVGLAVSFFSLLIGSMVEKRNRSSLWVMFITGLFVTVILVLLTPLMMNIIGV